jgi:hypothetical protein
MYSLVEDDILKNHHEGHEEREGKGQNKRMTMKRMKTMKRSICRPQIDETLSQRYHACEVGPPEIAK